MLLLLVLLQVLLLVTLCGKKKTKSDEGVQSNNSYGSGETQKTKSVAIGQEKLKTTEAETDKKETTKETEKPVEPVKKDSKEKVVEEPLDKTQLTDSTRHSVKSTKTKTLLPVQQTTDNDPGGYENVNDMNEEELAKIAAEVK